MDTTTLFIIGQIVLLLIAGIVFLALYARKQKNAVQKLQDLLLEYKEDLSGDNLTRYLQLSLDDTSAHTGQETVALKPDAAADQMAISLRHHALAAELALLQTYNGELSPWKSAIAPYIELATQLTEHIQQVPEAVKAELIPKIDNLEKQVNDFKSKYEQTKNQLENYLQLENVYKDATEDDVNKQQLEVQLHHALLALAENLENAEALREVIYLMHEGYLEASQGSKPEEQAAESAEASDDDATVVISNDEIATENEEMHVLIEKFAEESAEHVERIYMLANENKMLKTENDDLKEQIKAYTEQQEASDETAPIIAGLKMKIESQVEEIMQLQSNFRRLEDKYLSLYSEKLDDESETDGEDGDQSTLSHDSAAIEDTNIDAASETESDLDVDTDLGIDTDLGVDIDPDEIINETVSENTTDDAATAPAEMAEEPSAKREEPLAQQEEPSAQQEDDDDLMPEIDFASPEPKAETASEPPILEETETTEPETVSNSNKGTDDDPDEEDKSEDAVDPDAILAEMEQLSKAGGSDK